MEEIKIEKGIPIPKKIVGMVSRSPISKMEVGDSVLFSGKYKEIFSRIRSSVSYYGARHKMKFSQRKVEGGIRVWRIE
jgi:hypothetical protein